MSPLLSAVNAQWTLKVPFAAVRLPWFLCSFSHGGLPLQPPCLFLDSSKGLLHPHILCLQLFILPHSAKLSYQTKAS